MADPTFRRDAILHSATERFHEKRDRIFRARITQALEAALDRTMAVERDAPRVLDLDIDRYIIFSDQHRGARNRADDFRRCERAYNAALAYYYRMGYTLVALGDAEELWEESPAAVVGAYAYGLELEAQFHKADRYVRIRGNHDDAWQDEATVRRHLEPFFPGLVVHEGVRIRVERSGTELGHLFLVHGHQGTGASDRYARFSRLYVRYVWRNIQRVTNLSWNTPAKDWRLRQRHDAAMYAWSRTHRRQVLITGHTHRPVFKSKSHAARVQEELLAVEAALQQDPDDSALLQKTAELGAELEWARAQEQTSPGQEGIIAMEKPCYFNTGCCSFMDGDATGIEIAEGAIKLVRWPDNEGRPRAQELASASLSDVLDACG